MNNPTPIEQWKPMRYNDVLYPFYEVSNLGRIRSLSRFIDTSNNQRRFIQGKIRTLRTNKIEEYLFLDVAVKDSEGHTKMKSVYVHKAVWESFKGSTGNKYVSHKDNNVRHNFLKNLFLITHSDLQKANMVKYPENKWRLSNNNTASGYYESKTLPATKIKLIRKYIKYHKPARVAHFVGVSISSVYKYIKDIHNG